MQDMKRDVTYLCQIPCAQKFVLHFICEYLDPWLSCLQWGLKYVLWTAYTSLMCDGKDNMVQQDVKFVKMWNMETGTFKGTKAIVTLSFYWCCRYNSIFMFFPHVNSWHMTNLTVVFILMQHFHSENKSPGLHSPTYNHQ